MSASRTRRGGCWRRTASGRRRRARRRSRGGGVHRRPRLTGAPHARSSVGRCETQMSVPPEPPGRPRVEVEAEAVRCDRNSGLRNVVLIVGTEVHRSRPTRVAGAATSRRREDAADAARSASRAGAGCVLARDEVTRSGVRPGRRSRAGCCEVSIPCPPPSHAIVSLILAQEETPRRYAGGVACGKRSASGVEEVRGHSVWRP